jgi:MFS family permease
MRPRLVLVVLGSAQLLIALDHNIVYVALPEVAASLDLEQSAAQWVVTAYALGFGGFLLLGGRLADAVGPREVLRAGLGLHVACATVGALAPSPEWLVAARAGQGVGSALLFPATLAILHRSFAGSSRVCALAVWGAAGGFGGAFGSLIGGVLVGAAGWRAVLWATVPLSALALLGAGFALPRFAGSSAAGWSEAPNAIAGTLAATFAVLALAERLAWSAAAAVAIALVFHRLERCARAPLLPRALLADRRVQGGMLLAFAFMASFGGQFFLLTVFLQHAAGLAPAAAGAAFLPLTLAILLGTQLGATAIRRCGAAGAAAAGFGAGAVGMIVCALATANGSMTVLVFGMAVDGLGQGVAWTGLWAVVGEGAGHRQGLANGMAATSQQLGGAAGLALWVAIPAGAAWVLAAGILAIAAAAARTWLVRSAR